MSLYTPRHFQSSSDEHALRIIADHPFATLITSTAGAEPHVTHLPLLWQDGALVGHVAKPNPHWRAFAEGHTVALFHGPHQYISPRGYERPEDHVPTWNYATVHVHGRPGLLDAAAARAAVEHLTEHFEQGRWRAAPEKLERLLPGIVAFRMLPARIEAKFKMSQNRAPADRAGVMAALEHSGMADDAALVRWMRRSND